MKVPHDDRKVKDVTHVNEQKQSEEECGRYEPSVDSGEEINT